MNDNIAKEYWGKVDERKWDETSCRTFRQPHDQFHRGDFVKECWEAQDEPKRRVFIKRYTG